MPEALSADALVQMLPGVLFTMAYRKGHRVNQTFIVATSFRDAEKEGRAYCERCNMTFVSVCSAITDTSRDPNKSTNQQGESNANGSTPSEQTKKG